MLTKRFSDRAPVQLLFRWLQLPRSTFYYKAHPGQRGMRPSTHTLYHGSLITNEEVVGKIKELISGPYNAYGYPEGCKLSGRYKQEGGIIKLKLRKKCEGKDETVEINGKTVDEVKNKIISSLQ